MSAGQPRRALSGLLRPRLRRVDLLVALLLAALGFGAAVQVRSTDQLSALGASRPEDLVRILDDLSGRDARLRAEVEVLTAARERLAGAGTEDAALEEARRRAQLLGVLAGTVPATGPGVLLEVQDRSGGVRADVLLDALEELRAAGAEAVQLEGQAAPEEAGRREVVRVVASTWLLDEDDGVLVDGVLLRPPYTFTALGDRDTLASALAIPGGVVDTVARVGGAATVRPSDSLRVGALRPLDRPRYARPAPGG